MIPKANIMIVDDEPEALEQYRLLFETQDIYEIMDFTRPEKALEYLSNSDNKVPDIIISDISMPEMNGYLFGEEVRKDYRLMHIPFLYLTGKNTGHQDKILARTITPYFFEKDRNKQELISLVQSILVEHKIQIDINTLTRLPGNSLITREINHIVAEKDRYAVLYIDCDNFKAYNDVYGTDNGDKAIREVAKAIDRGLRQIVPKTYFLGHIGGDDFVAAAWGDFNIDILCKAIIGQMDKVRCVAYAESDVARGYFEGKNRKGETEKYNLLSISIGVIISDFRKAKNWPEASNMLTEVKRAAKAVKGDSYYVDQRKSE
ncbi:MAG: response regulator [Elusimicrobiota bacterium]